MCSRVIGGCPWGDASWFRNEFLRRGGYKVQAGMVSICSR
ncbi:hypothetical protein HMPREF3038_01793 [Akkermansia sp. KLE1797]|nr:hypothetical protein HMPREF3038_01793 [Akkermansia sp. KLE1797]KXU53815.1 hypothetical protein HMPREF3039_01954 [Akkermansia sp. KLE1798]